MGREGEAHHEGVIAEAVHRHRHGCGVANSPSSHDGRRGGTRSRGEAGDRRIASDHWAASVTRATPRHSQEVSHTRARRRNHAGDLARQAPKP